MSKKRSSREDHALWHQVAQSTKPFPGKMEELSKRLENGLSAIRPAAKKSARADAKPTSLPPPSLGPGEAAKRLAAHFSGLAGKSQTAAIPGPSLPAAERPGTMIERPVRRKLARGRLQIDASIDLHGMGLDEAHDRLRLFLADAQRRDLRFILVITGKGSSLGSAGALKRSVPQWLAKPTFSMLVSGHDQASRAHGGEGALYVRLKRRKPSI